MINSDIIECSKILLDRNLTIAFAESATAGRMIAEFALVPNAGRFLKGGLVCYDVDIKKDVLKVDEQIIEKCTPESSEVTEQLALGLSRLINASIHVAVTGLTAVGGSESAEKPVGTMFLHILLNGRELAKNRVLFTGDHEEIVLQTVFYTANLLKSRLENY
ncbi:MAG: CinA family protein [Pedobacter sp.]|nr:MAG: CinA family protein [Pedobacter sp.]